MTKNRNRNRNTRRRERSVLDQPLDSLWRDYEPVIGLLEDSDAEWERAITTTTPPYGRRPWVPAKPIEWDRMLWRPRTRFPDFDVVTEHLATGGMVKTKAEAQVLIDAGVTHVLNTSSELHNEHEVLAGLPLVYAYNPTWDNNQWKDPSWFKATLDFALPVIAQGGMVYIHCLEGINRGPSSAAAVLMALGHTGREAKELIQKARPRAKVAYLADAMEARQ
jgi:predicted protein tyrosine phosphatase